MITNFKRIPLTVPNEISQIDFLGESLLCAGRRHTLVLFDPLALTPTCQTHTIQSELTSLHVGRQQVLVGTGKGDLLKLDPKSLSVVGKSSLHSDCISGILELDHQYVTVGYDGMVTYTDKRKEGVVKTIQVDFPITQALMFQNDLYLAGVQAYRVSQEDQVEEFGRYHQFLEMDGRLFGANDLHGLVYLSMKDKKYVPCERMVGYKQGLLSTSWQTASYFTFDSEERVSWKSARVDGFLPGDSITSLLARQDTLFAGAESGNIYLFKFDENYSLLEQ